MCKRSCTTKAVSISRCESFEISLFYCKLSSRKLGNSFSVSHINFLKNSSDKGGKLDYNSSLSKSRGILVYHGPIGTLAHIGRTTIFNLAEPLDGSAKITTSVSLTEDDIPGAKLPKETPEEFNCWMLRRSLQCRGGRTTGKKAVLVQRYKAEIR